MRITFHWDKPYTAGKAAKIQHWRVENNPNPVEIIQFYLQMFI